ncbi:MAG: hypothetical protein KDA41_17940, partial [Planctomycetales bacterium]|nr:hypothetical protein [Planctomycetales bacterium]
MSFSPRTAVFTLALVAACAASAAAQDDPAIGSAEILEVDALRCRRLADSPDSTAQTGYLKMLSAPKDHVFLVLWSRLKLTFGKDEDGNEVARFEDSHFSLKDAKGKTYRIVGRCTRDGRFSEQEGWISENKEYLEGDKVHFQPVFVVPAAESEFTLSVAGGSKKVTAPMQIVDTIDRIAVATFKIDSVRIVDNIGQSRALRRYSDDEVEGLREDIESTVTRYVAVKFIIKPRRGNEENGSFYLYSSQIGLRYGAQVYVAPIGYFDDDEFYGGTTSVGDEPDAAGEFRAEAMELVFPLPGRLSSFQALYLMQEFGGAELPKQ